MITYRAALVASVLALTALANSGRAAELGAESIVHEQAQSQRAIAEQRQYEASHQHFKGMRAPSAPATSGVLPHHN